MSKGTNLFSALSQEKPLQIAGCVNAYCALLAKDAGFKALYISGAGVANASFALPDLGITSLNDVCEDVRRICGVVDLPVLVDADTGWGGAFNVARTVKELGRAGASACHIEDQQAQKRCGHRPGKHLCSKREMVDRVKAAVDAKADNNFAIMARTDALAVNGMDDAIDRANAYLEAGADMIFAEALETLEDFVHFGKNVDAPILANATEFGKTPLFTREDYCKVGVAMILYPLSAFRAMSQSAYRVYDEIRRLGTQENALKSMQTRESLYDFLDYYSYEQKLDALYGKQN